MPAPTGPSRAPAPVLIVNGAGYRLTADGSDVETCGLRDDGWPSEAWVAVDWPRLGTAADELLATIGHALHLVAGALRPQVPAQRPG